MTITHKTGLVALVVALLTAALLVPPTTASANEDVVDEGVFAIVGTAHLSAGIQVPPKEPGCLGGVAFGLGTEDDFVDETLALDPDLVVAAGSRVGAQFGYGNTLIDGEANGELWIEGEQIGVGDPSDDGTVAANTEFDWRRIGATALVTLGTDKKGGDEGNEYGVAVGLLLPVDVDLLFPTCPGEKKDGGAINHGAWPNDVHVQIVGVGVITTLCDGGPALVCQPSNLLP